MTTTLIDNSDIIETTFLLTSNNGFKGEPGWKVHGTYKISFKVMHNENNIFLRFLKLKKTI